MYQLNPDNILVLIYAIITISMVYIILNQYISIIFFKIGIKRVRLFYTRKIHYTFSDLGRFRCCDSWDSINCKFIFCSRNTCLCFLIRCKSHLCSASITMTIVYTCARFNIRYKLGSCEKNIFILTLYQILFQSL